MLAPFRQERLKQMGFGHFLSILEFAIRLMFLESVVERYNHRTISIVMRVSEFILSLEDMVHLTGLQVMGHPVIGLVRSDYMTMMRELVGSRVVMHRPCLFVTSLAVHQVEDSYETAMEPGVDNDQ